MYFFNVSDLIVTKINCSIPQRSMRLAITVFTETLGWLVISRLSKNYHSNTTLILTTPKIAFLIYAIAPYSLNLLAR